MSTTPEVAGTATAAAQKTRGRLAAFFCDDHRYVFLGTSAFALIGLALGNSAHSASSFLAASYVVESALYYVLLAWLLVSAVALVNKLVKWRDYAVCSPFAKPAAKRVERIASYVVWAVVVVFMLDRWVMGFCDLASAAVASETNPTDFWSSSIYMLWNTRSVFATGIQNTVLLALFGTIIAFFLSLLLVFLRIQVIDRSDNDFVRFLKVVGSGFARVYSTVVRGTPMMIQGLLIYFGGISVLKACGLSTGQIGTVWSTFVAGLVTISLNSTAYMMEVLRSGIGAVDSGQAEAARSLGLSQWQAMSKVVFPQAIKNSLPAIGNEFIINIKDSSVLCVVGVSDLMFMTRSVAGIYYKGTECYLIAAIAYLILTYLSSLLLNAITKKLDTSADLTDNKKQRKPASLGLPSSN